MILKKNEDGSMWELASLVKDANGKTTGAKLRSLSSALVEVSDAERRAGYTEVVEGTEVDKAVVETLATIRHNSTVRYVLLPFFLTASAVIANFHRAGDWKDSVVLTWVGIGVATLGLVIEVLLSRNLMLWHEALDERVVGPWKMLWAPRAKPALWAARIAFIAPYSFLLGFWAQIAFGKLFVMGLTPGIVAAAFSLGAALLTLGRSTPDPKSKA